MLLTMIFFMRGFLIRSTIITRTDRRVEGWLQRDGWIGGWVGGGMGGWVGLQKLITVLGRFYPYTGGV
jgi:hypothetical protein